MMTAREIAEEKFFDELLPLLQGKPFLPNLPSVVKFSRKKVELLDLIGNIRVSIDVAREIMKLIKAKFADDIVEEDECHIKIINSNIVAYHYDYDKVYTEIINFERPEWGESELKIFRRVVIRKIIVRDQQ